MAGSLGLTDVNCYRMNGYVVLLNSTGDIYAILGINHNGKNILKECIYLYT